jgi:hypothetical protein
MNFVKTTERGAVLKKIGMWAFSFHQISFRKSTFEEIFLRFVMEEMYYKVWNGTTWEPL